MTPTNGTINLGNKLSIFILATLLAGCARESQLPTQGRAAVPYAERLYLAVGDSITAGIGASHPEKGFAPLFGAYRDQWHPGTLTWNAGVDGATTYDIIQDVIPSLPVSLAALGRKPDVITVLLGVNELIRVYPSGPSDGAVFGCTYAQGVSWSYHFRSRLSEGIVKPLLRAGSPGCRMALLNLYESTSGAGYAVTCFGPEWLNGGSAQCLWPDGLRVWEEYNRRIAEVAGENGILLIDLASAFQGHMEDYVTIPLLDIHPTDAGHAAIARELEKYL